MKWKIQMILHLNWPFFRYDEHGSKNRAGGPKQLNLENKSITQFARKDTVSRCRYTLLQKYVSKLPPTTVTKDLFYCKPMHFKDSIPSDRPWYTDVPIGHNILQLKLKALLSSADIDPTKRVTTAFEQPASLTCTIQKYQKSSSWRGLVL